MKKTYSLPLSLSALALLGASCAQSDLFDSDGEVKQVTFTAEFPQELTRAAADGSDIRLDAFVYDTNGTYVTREKGTLTSASDNKINATVTMQLATNVTYKVVFWASTDGKTTINETAASTALTTPYELVYSTGQLKVNYGAMTVNSEDNDAFYLAKEYTISSETDYSATLTRPLAQVNFGTADLTDASVKTAYKEDGETAVYTNVQFKASNELNLVTGTLNAPSESYYSTTVERIPTYGGYPVIGYNYTNKLYLLAPNGTTTLADLKFNSYVPADKENPCNTVEVGSAPIQANYRTNIYGNLLTSTTDFSVNINEGFGGSHLKPIEVSTPEQLAEALAAQGNLAIKITKELVVTKPYEPEPGTPQAPRTIDITLAEDVATSPSFSAGAHTTIVISQDGSSSIQKAMKRRRAAAAETTTAPLGTLTVKNGGTIIVHGGKFAGLVNEENTGFFKIYGGKFTSDPTPYVEESQRDLIVNDGTYFKFDPVVWDGIVKRVVTPTTGADGTPIYTITSPSQYAWYLAKFPYGPDKAHAISIEADLDFGGNKINPLSDFSGTFDGHNHTFKNFSINSSSNGALIAQASNCTISNIIVENATIHAYAVSLFGYSLGANAGGILGYAYGNVTIENCHVKNSNISCSKGEAAGGIVGRAYGANQIIRNCSNSGNVTGNNGSPSKVGGMVGINSSSGSLTIEDCFNSGDIGVTNSNDCAVGGMVGYGGLNLRINRCTNNGRIGSTVNGAIPRWAGGMIGGFSYNVTLTNYLTDCVNNGTVQGDKAAGMVAYIQTATISMDLNGCRNTGAIKGVNHAGGIFACFRSPTVLTNCSNSGSVEATGNAGGVVGSNELATPITITNCDGGSNTITGAATGRIIGNLVSGATASISIPTTGNATSETLRHIGKISASTATISSGTLIGNPVSTSGTVTINEGAAWNLFPGQTGSWKASATGWTKQ